MAGIDSQYYIPDAPRNWPKIILIVMAVVVFVLAIIFGAPYLKDKLTNKLEGDIDNIVNDNGSQGIAVGEPNPNTPTNNSSSSLGQHINCEEDYYNCGNFTTQSEAQQVFDACVDNGSGDVHQLDGDGNDQACESLD